MTTTTTTATTTDKRWLPLTKVKQMLSDPGLYELYPVAWGQTMSIDFSGNERLCLLKDVPVPVFENVSSSHSVFSLTQYKETIDYEGIICHIWRGNDFEIRAYNHSNNIGRVLIHMIHTPKSSVSSTNDNEEEEEEERLALDDLVYPLAVYNKAITNINNLKKLLDDYPPPMEPIDNKKLQKTLELFANGQVHSDIVIMQLEHAKSVVQFKNRFTDLIEPVLETVDKSAIAILKANNRIREEYPLKRSRPQEENEEKEVQQSPPPKRLSACNRWTSEEDAKLIRLYKEYDGRIELFQEEFDHRTFMAIQSRCYYPLKLYKKMQPLK